MAEKGTIVTLYEDLAKTKPILPITKTKAITNDANISLDDLLANAGSINAKEVAELNPQPSSVDANTLDGKDSTYFAKAADLNNLKIKALTRAQYQTETKHPGTLYFIIEE